MDVMSTLPAPVLLNGERLFSFSTIAAKLPGHRGNAHANASTVFRWATKGVRVGDVLVKLEVVRLGTSWKTSLEAVARFSAKLTAVSTAPAEHPTTETSLSPRQRNRRAASASARLDAFLAKKK